MLQSDFWASPRNSPPPSSLPTPAVLPQLAESSFQERQAHNREKMPVYKRYLFVNKKVKAKHHTFLSASES
jgi:hypothetical protein